MTTSGHAAAVLSESTWQHKVLLASQYMRSSSNDDSSISLPDWFVNNDNTSHRCLETASTYCACPSPPLLLRWAKGFFQRMAHNYWVEPFLLMLMPLLVGMLVGIWLGRRSEKQWRLQEQECSEAVNMIVNQSDKEYKIGPLTWTMLMLKSLGNYVPAVLRSTENVAKKEDRVRVELRSEANTSRESGVDLSTVPQHIAVIMDGNRRYGKSRYGSETKGHWDGSRTLVDFAKWCIAEGVQVLTVYAFSTENWNRDPSEVASLMALFCKYCDELRIEAIERNIRIRVLSTETDKIPLHVKAGLRRMVDETMHCDNGLTMNICLSYGSRGEIVQACRSLAMDAMDGKIKAETIQERDIQERLLTSHCIDPDVVIRTSGEYRLSNFLLWQLAYAEMFFIPKQWPEMEKEDLLKIIRTYSNGRCRRFGK